MARFHLVLVLCLCAGAVCMVPSANAQTVAATTCATFTNAKDPAQQALYLAYLQGYANASRLSAGNIHSDTVLADNSAKVRDWCGKNSKSTYAEAVAAVLGAAPNNVRHNAPIGLLRNHLFPSPELARIPALELAKARQQILKFPTSDTWRMPAIYTQKNPVKQSPPVPDPHNVWYPLGPQPIAADPRTVWGAMDPHETGRIISIAAAPQGQIYAGGEFGGVWVYSQSSSPPWVPLTDSEVSPQIGAIAIDPSNSQIIYAGTGMNNSVGPCAAGVFAQGVLKSPDGGGSWTLLGSNSLAGAGIARILVGQGAVLAATSSGIFVSSNGGNSWSQTHVGCVTDMAFSAVNATTLYAATQTGLIISTNSGMTWSSSGINQPGLPTGFGPIYHTALGVALGSAGTDVLYVSMTGWGNGQECATWAPSMSPDGGQTWSTPGSPPSGWCGIGWANTLAVDPANAGIVAFGGDWLYIYNASSTPTWTQVSPVSAVGHSDTRALAFDASGHLYVGNDGGVWEVPDPTNPTAGMGLNDGGLQVTEFYPGLGESNGGALLMAGSQDNGTEIYQGSLTWSGVLGGDGAAAAIDQNNGMHLFAEALDPSPVLEETFDVANSTNPWPTQLPPGFQSPHCSIGTGVTSKCLPLAISPAPPGLVSGPTVLYIGSNEIYQFSAPSSGGPMVWTTLTQACPGQLCSTGCNPNPKQNKVASLEVDPLNPSYVLAGWCDGTVNFSTDSGNTWTSATQSQPIGGGITAIATSPVDPYSIAVTTESGHVWIGSKINTSSPVWSDDTGNLPVVPGIGLNAAIYSAGGLIVASDTGVFEQGSIGASWATLGTGLPNTKVVDLQWNPAWDGGSLVAITYGRGAWGVSPPPPPCRVGKFTSCLPTPAIRTCPGHICLAVCDHPCSGSVVQWNLPFSDAIDPSLVGTSFNLLVTTPVYAGNVAADLQVEMSTESYGRAISGIDGVVVGAFVNVSARPGASQRLAKSTRDSIAELSLSYDAAIAHGARLRMVKYDQRDGRWLDVGAQTVNASKHLVTARVSTVGKYTIVAETLPAKH